MKRENFTNDRTNDYAGYIERCLNNIGITPSIDRRFEGNGKIAIYVFKEIKAEIFLNPYKDNQCHVSLYLDTRYTGDGKRGQKNIKFWGVGDAMVELSHFIERYKGIDLRTDIERRVETEKAA